MPSNWRLTKADLGVARRGLLWCIATHRQNDFEHRMSDESDFNAKKTIYITSKTGT